MKVNGNDICLQDPLSLYGFLEKQGYHPMQVAVEKNGVIIARADFAKTMLDNEDVLEIVCFVGGG